MSKDQTVRSVGKEKNNFLLLGLILLISLVLRLYKVDTPLADWHSWRQVDTASVTKEYLKNGVDLLRPRYLDLSNIPSGMENPQGYRMVEFPIINGVTAWLYEVIPQNLEVHVFSRLVSIVFSLGSLVLLYLIVRLFASQKEALVTALVFGILPYNVYYSRTILPEVPMVFFALGSIYFTSKYLLSNRHTISNGDYWLGVGFTLMAMLLKPYLIILALPLIYLGYKQCGNNLIRDWKSYLFLILAVGPLFLWRWWIGHFPEGIPAYLWLLNGNQIRFKGAWFRWIFADRIGRLMLGYWGLVLAGFGILVRSKTQFFNWWGLSILVYLAVFATGNVQHDYYQIILVPILAVFVAKGIMELMKIKTIIAYGLLTVSFFFMLAFGWYEVRGYYNINNPAIVEAGKEVDKLTEPEALVIAPYRGDTAFLYQTNRKGWPIGGNIDQRITQGADYYVTTAMDDEAKELMERCEVVSQTDSYLIVSLHKCDE